MCEHKRRQIGCFSRHELFVLPDHDAHLRHNERSAQLSDALFQHQGVPGGHGLPDHARLLLVFAQRAPVDRDASLFPDEEGVPAARQPDARALRLLHSAHQRARQALRGHHRLVLLQAHDPAQVVLQLGGDELTSPLHQHGHMQLWRQFDDTRWRRWWCLWRRSYKWLQERGRDVYARTAQV